MLREQLAVVIDLNSLNILKNLIVPSNYLQASIYHFENSTKTNLISRPIFTWISNTQYVFHTRVFFSLSSRRKWRLLIIGFLRQKLHDVGLCFSFFFLRFGSRFIIRDKLLIFYAFSFDDAEELWNGIK